MPQPPAVVQHKLRLVVKPIINKIPKNPKSHNGSTSTPSTTTKFIGHNQQPQKSILQLEQLTSKMQTQMFVNPYFLNNPNFFFENKTSTINFDSEIDLENDLHQCFDLKTEYFLMSSSHGFAKNNKQKHLADYKQYKSNNYGDDSYFIRFDSLGVADGVGGWNKIQKANPLYYSMNLMHYSYEQLENLFKLKNKNIKANNLYHENVHYSLEHHESNIKNKIVRYYNEKECQNDSFNDIKMFPRKILENSYEIVKQKAKMNDIKGSTTACLAILQGKYLTVTNLGDCGLILIRNRHVVFKTEEQQHTFNLPYQLGTNSKDTPNDAMSFSIEVENGDIIVMGSDGLFDNLFDRRIVDIVSEVMCISRDKKVGPILNKDDSYLNYKSTTVDGIKIEKKMNFDSKMIINKYKTDSITKRLASEALRMSKLDRTDTKDIVPTPFCLKMLKNGYKIKHSGKKDDITVLAAIILSSRDNNIFETPEASKEL